MKFIERIAQKATALNGNVIVREVIIGLSYCYVILENGDSGLSFVFKDDHVSGCNVPLPKRPLAGSRASELLAFAGQGSLANSIALAVANAICLPLAEPESSGDFIDNFSLQAGVKVGMVGHFGPLAPIIREQGADLTIFDLHPPPFSTVLSSDKIPQVMPDCEVALITATSIINETIDDILPFTENCKYVALLGPSSPLAKMIYEGTNVSCAAGATVKKTEMMKQAIMEAGGMAVFSPYINKVNVAL